MPMAARASATAPNTVISHMLKRDRDNEFETTSSMVVMPANGSPLAARSSSWICWLTVTGEPCVRTIQAIGMMPVLS